jgi:IclR family acetate operon transcriptional repressor
LFLQGKLYKRKKGYARHADAKHCRRLKSGLRVPAVAGVSGPCGLKMPLRGRRRIRHCGILEPAMFSTSERGWNIPERRLQKSVKNDQRLNVLGKALAVLQAVADHPQGVGLPDLAAKLGLPRQTVHRVLGQLRDSGLLLRDPVRERFSVGPRLVQLALAALGSNNPWAPVRQVLQELVDEVGETCNIGVLEGLDYVYVDRIECQWPLRIHLEVGYRTPANCISGGKVLLAYLEPQLRGRLLRSRKLVARTSRSIARVTDLEAELDKVRACGYGTNDEENFDGIVAVAVPIMDANGRVVAALTMHGPLPRLTQEGCKAALPRLRQAAQDIARAWGLT